MVLIMITFIYVEDKPENETKKSQIYKYNLKVKVDEEP